MSSSYLSALRIRLPLLLLLGLSLPAIGSVQSQSLSDSSRVTGWRSDISYYLEQMRRQHYTYRSRPLPKGLIDAANRLAANVPRYSDERILAEFAHLASFAGDGHTYILPFGSRRVTAHMLPLRFFLFRDGMYIIDAFPGYERWIGSRVVRVGDTPAETVIDRMRPALSADNRFGYLWVAPALLSFQGYLENFADGIRSDSVALTLKPAGGRELRVKIAPVIAPRMRGIPKLLASRVPGTSAPPAYLSNVAQNFWIKPLADSVLYVQFNQVMNAQDEPLAAFAAKLDKTITDTRPRAVVVDVRHNNGGNLMLLPPLLNALRRYEQTNKGGRIYVLMGRNTFSAAQVFLAQMDRYTNAIFAGEPSSSRPNFVGEETPVELPWSGAIGSISDEYHETIPGDKREWIEPDIKLVLSSQDYFANRDPLLDKVLAHAKKNASEKPLPVPSSEANSYQLRFWQRAARSVAVQFLPVPLLPHYVDRADQPIGRVTPVCLHCSLRNAGIPRANCLDDSIVLGPGCCHSVEQKRDIHPDVALCLWLHCFVQSPKAGAGAGFDIASMKFFVQLVQPARLGAARGCGPPKVTIERGEVLRQTLAFRVGQSGGATGS